MLYHKEKIRLEYFGTDLSVVRKLKLRIADLDAVLNLTAVYGVFKSLLRGTSSL